MNPLLNVNGLSIWFRSRGAERLVVSDLSLSIAAGEVLSLVGGSGSGKSVTALAILRLLDAAVSQILPLHPMRQIAMQLSC